jgi:phytoene dehydrogenase-like protein
MSLPVVIIGAGLAGLNCARVLHAQGERVLLIDANDRIGGRVQTDVVEGFQLDHGFQVFQTAYPEAKLALDYANLHLTRLETGALIRHRGAWVRMADPWRQPQYALSTLFNSVGNVADRFRLFQLRRHVLSKSPDELLRTTNDCTTREYLLEHWRFSKPFYDLFLKPWWSGIFLETELNTSAAYLQFVFHMLAAGDVALPRSGMQAIPNQLASQLPQDSIRLSSRVSSIKDREVQVSTGEAIAARAVVLATDSSAAAQLTASRADSVQPQKWSCTTCMYFSADRPPSDTKLLMLLADPIGPANHVFIPSNSVPSFAPSGQSLISVSLVNATPTDESLPTVIEQLREVFGSQVDSWRHLRTYNIPHALPVQPPGFRQATRMPVLQDDIIVCGDYLETSSIQGALVSGRKAASKVL